MKKITQAHSTYIEEAEELLKFLNKEPSVKKIVLGRIVVKVRSSKSITPPKVIESTGCLLIKINSKQSNQEIRAYSDNCATLKSNLNIYLKTISH